MREHAFSAPRPSHRSSPILHPSPTYSADNQRVKTIFGRSAERRAREGAVVSKRRAHDGNGLSNAERRGVATTPMTLLFQNQLAAITSWHLRDGMNLGDGRDTIWRVMVIVAHPDDAES